MRYLCRAGFTHNRVPPLSTTNPPCSPFAYAHALNPLIAGVARRPLTPLFPLAVSPPSHARSSPVFPPSPAQQRPHCEFHALYPPYAPHHAACGAASALLYRAASSFIPSLSDAQACAGIVGGMGGGAPPANGGVCALGPVYASLRCSSSHNAVSAPRSAGLAITTTALLTF